MCRFTFFFVGVLFNQQKPVHFSQKQKPVHVGQLSSRLCLFDLGYRAAVSTMKKLVKCINDEALKLIIGFSDFLFFF